MDNGQKRGKLLLFIRRVSPLRGPSETATADDIGQAHQIQHPRPQGLSR